MSNEFISRSALKESIRKRLCISSLEYLTEQEKVIVDEIDNAQPVEPLAWQIQFFKRLYEKLRPQGEWLELKTNPPEIFGHKFYICSKCGREIDVMTPDESLDDYPYCHCGACMIKEKEK